MGHLSIVHVRVTNVHISIAVSCTCTLNRVTRGNQNSYVHCNMRACTYVREHVGQRHRACMARKNLVQLSTDMHDFEKYSRGATKHTCVTRTHASSLN